MGFCKDDDTRTICVADTAAGGGAAEHAGRRRGYHRRLRGHVERGEGEGEGEAGGLLVARGLGGDAELDTGGAVGAAGPEGQVWGGAAEIDQGVLGAFVGDDVDCSERLVARQAKALQPLRRAVRLRDTQEIHVAMQVQMMIVRYCANTQLNYFLRAMPLIVGKRVKAVSLARRTQIGWLYTWYSRRNATRPRSADHIYCELQLYSRTCHIVVYITVCTVRCVLAFCLSRQTPLLLLIPCHTAVQAKYK